MCTKNNCYKNENLTVYYHESEDFSYKMNKLLNQSATYQMLIVTGVTNLSLPLTFANRSHSRPLTICLTCTSRLPYQAVSNLATVCGSGAKANASHHHSTKPWSFQVRTLHTCHEETSYTPQHTQSTLCMVNTVVLQAAIKMSFVIRYC